MALWVWRFVEGDPPHFFSYPQLYIIICGVCGG